MDVNGLSFLEFMKPHFEKAAKKDILPNGERFGQIVALVFIGIGLAFFTAHLNSNTGFFKSNFGAFEALLFFGIAIYGILPTVLKFIFGRKNRVRPFEFASNVMMIFAAIYFLATWPFDFTHLADVLPAEFQFLNSIGDQVMQLLVTIGIPILAIATIIELLTYFGVKSILESGVPQPVIEPIKPKEN